LDHGVIGDLGSKGIEFRVADEGDWLGVRAAIKLRKGKKIPYTMVLPQVGARKSPQDAWVWYTEKEITADFASKYPTGSEYRFVGPSEAARERLIKRIQKTGVKYRHGGTLNPPIGKDGKVALTFTNEFQVAVRRCIAKIAFNYLAYTMGADFVLRQDFDQIRSFVRYGAESAAGIVYLTQRSFLGDEYLSGVQITDGHIITAQWSSDNRSLIGKLALFNSLRYKVVLCPSYSGIWIEISRGHHFDIHSRTVEELSATRLIQPVVSKSRAER
jgi:hypothetical protein